MGRIPWHVPLLVPYVVGTWERRPGAILLVRTTPIAAWNPLRSLHAVIE